MSKRVEINKNGDITEIIIHPFFDASKQKVLMTWIVFWSICGMVIIAQLFFDYAPKTKLFIGIYTFFWFYFEFKTVYAYRWRKFGKEIITLKNDQFSYLKTIKKRGIENIFDLKDIQDFKSLNNMNSGIQGFFTAMNNSYWSPNANTIEAIIKNQPFYFGLELEDKDRKKVLNVLRTYLKNN